MKTSAMIFAAGLGSRLYPLTQNKPKALIKLNGVTLLEMSIRKIMETGIQNIVINTHHFSNQIIDFLSQCSFKNVSIRISEEKEILLDTAGGLKKAAPLFEESENILLYNVDIVSDINLNQMLQYHVAENNLATIAVRNRKTARYFIFNKDTMRLCGWKNKNTGEVVIVNSFSNPCELAFSGIHIVNRELLKLIPPTAPLSMTVLYLELCRQYSIAGYLHQKDNWFDIGKYDETIAHFGNSIQ